MATGVSVRARLAIGVAALSAALFAFAFVAAPQACEWGIGAYFCAGIAVIVTLIAWPFVAARDRSLATRLGLAVAFAVLGVAVWIGGLAASNFRIMCRMF